MANRPKRKRKPTSQPNTFTPEEPNIGTNSTETPDTENKTYRNKSRKKKPFVQYLSLKKYTPKVDKYFN